MPDLWRLSWPVMMFMVFQTSLELVDFYWVGMLGTDAVAALSLANNIFWMLFTFSQLITISTLSLTSRYSGSDDYAGVERVARHTLWLAIIMSLLIIAFIFLLGDLVLSLYQVEPQVHQMAMSYLQIAGVGFIFLYGGVGLAFSLQGVGDSVTPMTVLVLTNIINMVLDPIFIFGWLGLPSWGIFGAGLASLVARMVGFSIMLFIVLTGRISSSGLRIRGLFSLRLQWAYFKRMLQIGLPACLQGMTRPVTGAVMMWVVALFGTEAVAAFGVGLRLLSFCFILISGLSMGTSTMVGQTLGAELRELTATVIQKAFRMALTIQTVMALVAFLAAPQIMSAFADDPLVIEMGVAYIRMVSPALIAMGPMHVFAAVFKGSGHTVPPMAGALIANWLVKIPLALFFSLFLNLETNGVWLAITVSIFAEMLLLYCWFRRREWLYREVRVEVGAPTQMEG